jgi:hypothetical protein
MNDDEETKALRFTCFAGLRGVVCMCACAGVMWHSCRVLVMCCLRSHATYSGF